MEESNVDVFDPLGLWIIRDDYEKALECLDRALTADEAGNGAEALKLYRRGRHHLHRGVGVDSARPECVGPAWDSARQMQLKMSHTLGNITTRLAALETTPMPASTRPSPPEPNSAQRSHPAPLALDRQGASAPTRAPLPEFTPMSVSPMMHRGVPGDLPPAYTPQAAVGHLTLSYGTEAGELSLVRETPPPLHSPSHSLSPSLGLGGEEGKDLLFLPQGVQIFFVGPEGHVSAPSYPGYLRIARLNNRQHTQGAHEHASVVLQVCDWVYPLTPTSPVLLCNTGVFMFPDMMAATPGSYVGVVLSSDLPESDRQLFEDHLSQLTDLRLQEPEGAAAAAPCEKVPLSPLEEITALGAAAEKEEEEDEEDLPLPEWSEKVAHGILTGASWLSWGLVKGAEYTGIAIHKGASKLRERITPEDTPAEVSPNVAKGLHVAKQATGGAVKVSQFLVDGVCTVAGCVGRELAPHVKKHGSKLIPESMKKDAKGRATLDGAKAVAASGMQGLATVWTGLEVASKNIGKSVATETVSTVKHKYGPDAGQATNRAVDCTVDLGTAAINFNHLAIKGLTKAARTQASGNGGEESPRPQINRGKKEEKREE